ncbi:plexin-2-like [Mercenaria mercenaria]|uniref:plexin-2-like n=1 Tax=Mercenaria mercenaria TaxID=6596 RepID=UPI00234E6D1F|nr:plexin-2-like [Mercenaria mercenaria]
MNPTFDLVTRKDQLIQTTTYSPNELICKTGSVDEDKLQDVLVQIDGARVLEEMNITYLYVADPVITDIHPKKSFYSGGITLTVEGSNLNTIQTPMVYAIIDGFKTISENCTKSGETDAIHCPSPRYKNTSAVSGLSMVKGKNGSEYVSARLGFEMDGVASVTADNLHSHIATLEYVTDPVLENFTEVKLYHEHQPYLVINGYRLMHAANKHDVKVIIGCEFCNVTFASNVEILCKPPVDKPACGKSKEEPLDVYVWIGYFHQSVGFFAYETSVKETSNPTYMIVAVLLATAVIVIVVSIFAYCKCRTKHRVPSNDVTSVVFRRNQTEEMNERRTTASASHACARETSNIYDVIHDHEYHNCFFWFFC